MLPLRQELEKVSVSRLEKRLNRIEGGSSKSKIKGAGVGQIEKIRKFIVEVTKNFKLTEVPISDFRRALVNAQVTES